MDNWPHIPGQRVGSAPTRANSALPAPGTVIMASVEEDLGEGMYALRWSGTRIAVSSRVSLQRGQSLILKSETSPEGKPTLVVQGPALPGPGAVAGRVVYGPGIRGGGSGSAPAAAPPEPAPQAATGDMAAGVAKAAPTALSPPIPSLLGAVLEPLGNLDADLARLLEAAFEEKAKWSPTEKENAARSEEKGKPAANEKLSAEAGQTRPAAAELAARPTGPATRPASSQPAAAPPSPPSSGSGAASPAVPQNAADALSVTIAMPETPKIDSHNQTRPTVPGAEEKSVANEKSATEPDQSRPPAAEPSVRPFGPTSRPAVPQSVMTPPLPTPSPAVGQTHAGPASAASTVPTATTSVPATPEPSVIVTPTDVALAVNLRVVSREIPPPAPAQASAPPETPAPPDREVQAVPVDTVRSDVPATDRSRPPIPEIVNPPSAASQLSREAPVISPPPAAPQGVVSEAAAPAAGPLPSPVAISPSVPLEDARPAETPPLPVEPVPPSQGDGIPQSSATARPSAANPAPAQPGTATTGAGVPEAPSPVPSPPQPQETVTVPQMTGIIPEKTVPPSGTPVPPSPNVDTLPASEISAASDFRRPTAPATPQPTPPASANPATRPAEATAESVTSPPSSTSAETVVTTSRDVPVTPSTPPADHSRSPEGPRAQGAAELSPQARPTTPGAGDLAKAEAYIKEALTQLVKAAELPLGSPSADNQALGNGVKMPEAIADKAAGILLRAAGLTPDAAAMEAARALVDHNVPVDRQTVQAMLAITAGIPEEDREALLQAAARLSGKDIPLAVPLASGLATVIDRRAGVHELIDRTVAALTEPPSLPAAKPAMDAARELLDMLQVDLGRADASSVLERYISTFGREALGNALSLVENAAQTVLENHPVLPQIDRSLAAILALLEKTIGPTVGGGAGGEQTPAAVAGAVARPAQSQEEPSATPSREKPAQTTTDTVRPADLDAPRMPSHSPLNAYLRAPKAFPGLEALNLPPMPRVVSLQDAAPMPEAPVPAPAGQGNPSPINALPVSPTPSGLPANLEAEILAARPEGQASPSAPTTQEEGEAKAMSRDLTNDLIPEKARVADGEARRDAAGGGAEAGQRLREAVLMKLEAIFQTPGLNRPEFELLRPSGVLERFLNQPSPSSDREKNRAAAETLVKDLLSNDPEKARQTMRSLARQEPAVLRETAARLTRMEAEIIRSEPLLTRLSDAANSLRDLGRQLLAVKAENVAGQERDPGVMLAEVPFKLNEDGGDGRMQMFYRKAKATQGGWTSRVILDLNTTSMGPVLGDMRFFGQDMTVNMFVEKPETAAFLGRAADQLTEALENKGFRVKTRFMVLPPPPPPPEITAERPAITGENDGFSPPTPASSTPGTGVRGRLDVKG